MKMIKTDVVNNAIKWIHNNTVDGKGIAVTARHHDYYPEVTGYFIPSLLLVDEIELAKAFAQSLCELQHEDGAWYDTSNKTPFIFDTCQILKGLMSIRNLMPKVDKHIIKAIEWVFSNQTSEGRLIQSNTDIWGG